MTRCVVPPGLQKLLTHWSTWEVDSLLGKGAFGSVYKIVRHEMGQTYAAALKWIPLPTDNLEEDEKRASGLSQKGVATYYEGLARDLQREIKLLYSLRGKSHIVSYEDHLIKKRETGPGWDILIRMELLTPLNEYIAEHPVTYSDLIRMGKDLCDALILCQKHNILHRDIKPENIFISDSGDFKLGDFGIARKLESTKDKLTKRQGTMSYMAPEVYKGAAYDSSADMYSLGMVLYRLLNNRREPFLPPFPELFTAEDEERARERRFSGDALPRPPHGSDRLWEIIRRACAPDPMQRYSGANQMMDDLASIESREGGEMLVFSGDENAMGLGQPFVEPGIEPHEPTESIFRNSPGKPIAGGSGLVKEETESVFKPAPESSPPGGAAARKHRKKIAVIAAVAFVAVIAILWVIIDMGNRNITVTRLRIAPVTASSLQLEWDSTGKISEFLVSYAPTGAGNSGETVAVMGNSYTLEGLIPAVEYAITVQAGGNLKVSASGSCKTLLPEAYDDYRYESAIGDSIFLYSYDHAMQFASNSLDTSAKNSLLRLVPDGEIILPDYYVKDSKAGYIVNVIHFFDLAAVEEQSLVLPFSCVLKINGGDDGSFRTMREVDISVGIGRLYPHMEAFSLDKMLDAYYRENNGWKESPCLVEIYIGDQLVISEHYQLVKEQAAI